MRRESEWHLRARDLRAGRHRPVSCSDPGSVLQAPPVHQLSRRFCPEHLGLGPVRCLRLWFPPLRCRVRSSIPFRPRGANQPSAAHWHGVCERGAIPESDLEVPPRTSTHRSGVPNEAPDRRLVRHPTQDSPPQVFARWQWPLRSFPARRADWPLRGTPIQYEALSGCIPGSWTRLPRSSQLRPCIAPNPISPDRFPDWPGPHFDRPPQLPCISAGESRCRPVAGTVRSADRSILQ